MSKRNQRPASLQHHTDRWERNTQTQRGQRRINPHHGAPPSQPQPSLAHQSLLIPVRDCRPYGEAKLGRAKWAFLTWQEKGLASTLMPGMRHSSSQPTHGAHPQVGFIWIVKALFWADSAKDRLHPTPTSWCHPTGPEAIPALPEPLCKHQSFSRNPSLNGMRRASQRQKGSRLPMPPKHSTSVVLLSVERKTCAGGGRQGEGC